MTIRNVRYRSSSIKSRYLSLQMLEILLIDRLIDEDVMAIAWESSIGTIWLPNMTEIHQEMDVILNVHKYGFQHAVWTNPKEGSVFSYVAPIERWPRAHRCIIVISYRGRPFSPPRSVKKKPSSAVFFLLTEVVLASKKDDRGTKQVFLPCRWENTVF